MRCREHILPNALFTALLVAFAMLGCDRGTEDSAADQQSGPIAPGAAPATAPASTPAGHFVYAKIAQSIPPLERASKYEDPLSEFLAANNLGEVTGGGTMMAKSGGIEYAGIDLELTDLKTAIPQVKKKLADLGAPKGSQLEYEEDGKPVVVPIRG
jgi:hypothetical protein